MEPHSKLADLLLLHQTCSSTEEAELIAEIVLECEDTSDVFAQKDILVENLIDNLGVEEAQARTIILEFERNVITGANSDHEESGSDDDGESSSSEDGTDDDDDGVEYLIDGECELCDRYIKLTKHHLVPKSTLPRMQTKLLHAAEAIEKGERDKALLILGPGLEDLLEDGENSGRGGGHRSRRTVLSGDKAAVRAILHDTCDICRQCHSTVHRTHGNMDLALHYNTVEKLLGDEDIAKFCKWASKQKAGKYSRS